MEHELGLFSEISLEYIQHSTVATCKDLICYPMLANKILSLLLFLRYIHKILEDKQ